MTCRNCGAENEAGAVFCGNCGVIQGQDDAGGTARVGPVGFSEAIRLGFQRWSDFQGRSTRAEYWWFVLFCFGASTIATIVDLGLGLSGILEGITSLVLLVPWLAVAARRLHDINRTGWWLLLIFGAIVIIPLFILLYFYLQPSDQGSNRFGPRP